MKKENRLSYILVLCVFAVASNCRKREPASNATGKVVKPSNNTVLPEKSRLEAEKEAVEKRIEGCPSGERA